MTSKQTKESKDLPSYAEVKVETSDPQINEILDAIASACQRLEDIGGEMDKARDALDEELDKKPRNTQRLEALRSRMDALMAQIVEIENRELPSLLRLFQEIGHEKSVAGLPDDVQKRLKGVARTGELDVSNEPGAGKGEDEESPWAVE